MSVRPHGAVEMIGGNCVERAPRGRQTPEAAAGRFGAGKFLNARGSESRKVMATGRRLEPQPRRKSSFPVPSSSPCTLLAEEMNEKNSTFASLGGRSAGSRAKSGFYMFFLALRGLRPYSARRAGSRALMHGATAVSILRRRKELDGKTTEQVQDCRPHGRESRHPEESRRAVLRRTVQAGG